MAEDDTFELDLDSVEDDVNRKNKIKERFSNLTGKVIEAAQERDTEKAKREEAEAKISLLEKERDFHASFADTVATHPNAREYKDAVFEKVRAGYTTEDAVLSVLAKEGKLTTQTPPTPKPESPAGGSATTVNAASGTKTLSEMSREEKLAKLKELEGQGEIYNG